MKTLLNTLPPVILLLVVILGVKGCSSAPTATATAEVEHGQYMDCVATHGDTNHKELARCMINQRTACQRLLADDEIDEEELDRYRDGDAEVVTRRFCFGDEIRKCIVTTCPEHSPDFFARLWSEIKIFGAGGVFAAIATAVVLL